MKQKPAGSAAVIYTPRCVFVWKVAVCLRRISPIKQEVGCNYEDWSLKERPAEEGSLCRHAAHEEDVRVQRAQLTDPRARATTEAHQRGSALATC